MDTLSFSQFGVGLGYLHLALSVPLFTYGWMDGLDEVHGLDWLPWIELVDLIWSAFGWSA